MTGPDLPDVGFGYRGAVHAARADARDALDAIAAWREQQPGAEAL